MDAFEELDIEVDVENAQPQLSAVISRFRPQWKDQWSMEKLVATGNGIFKCKQASDEGDKETILVRIFSDFAAKIYDLQTYTTIMRVAAVQGRCAEVLGRVKNGIVYRYTPGERLYSTDWLKEECVFRGVAKEIAEVHKIRPNDVLRCANQNVTVSEEPVLFPRMENYLSFLPDDLSELGSLEGIGLETKQELANEVEFVRQKIAEMKHKIVLSHCDLITANIIYNNETDTLKFIDWEASGFNYDSFDIAYFLCIPFSAKKVEGKFSCTFHPERRERQMSFIKAYFETLAQDDADGKVDDAEVEEMFEKCQIMGWAILLYRAILCYRLVKITNLGFSLTSFGNAHIREYFTRKDAAHCDTA